MPEFLSRLLEQFQGLSTGRKAVVLAALIAPVVLVVVGISVSRTIAMVFFLLSVVALILALFVLLVAGLGYLVQRGRSGSTRAFKLIGVGAGLMLVVSTMAMAATLGPATQLTEEEEAQRREERAQEREQADRERTERAQANAERRAQEEEPTPEPQEEEPAQEPEESLMELTPLPGVSASEAVSIAESMEMDCERSELSSGVWEQTIWETHCTYIDEHELEYSMTVWEIEDTDEAGMVSGELTDFEGRGLHGVAIEYLGAIAFLGTNGDESAEEWVADHVPAQTNAETEIGDVRLILTSLPDVENYDNWSIEVNPLD